MLQLYHYLNDLEIFFKQTHKTATYRFCSLSFFSILSLVPSVVCGGGEKRNMYFRQ